MNCVLCERKLARRKEADRLCTDCYTGLLNRDRAKLVADYAELAAKYRDLAQVLNTIAKAFESLPKVDVDSLRNKFMAAQRQPDLPDSRAGG